VVYKSVEFVATYVNSSSEETSCFLHVSRVPMGSD
jgi:hypothetical protein